MTFPLPYWFRRRRVVQVALKDGQLHALADGQDDAVVVCWRDDHTIHVFTSAEVFRDRWHPLEWLSVEIRDSYGCLRCRFRRHEVATVERMELHLAA
jgi:hypothetical protein